MNYNACISACARGAQWHPALQLLNMGPKGPDLVSFSSAPRRIQNPIEWTK